MKQCWFYFVVGAMFLLAITGPPIAFLWMMGYLP